MEIGKSWFFLDKKKKKIFRRFRFTLGLIYLKFLGQNIEIMNISSSTDEKKGNLKFLRWIDLSNELSKIKLVNKYVIIRGLRDWKILGRKKL